MRELEEHRAESQHLFFSIFKPILENSRMPSLIQIAYEQIQSDYHNSLDKEVAEEVAEAELEELKEK
jgi:uncharacterized iron-regulated protein